MKAIICDFCNKVIVGPDLISKYSRIDIYKKHSYDNYDSLHICNECYDELMEKLNKIKKENKNVKSSND